MSVLQKSSWSRRRCIGKLVGQYDLPATKHAEWAFLVKRKWRRTKFTTESEKVYRTRQYSIAVVHIWQDRGG